LLKVLLLLLLLLLLLPTSAAENFVNLDDAERQVNATRRRSHC
jgi:hypothetical protein